MYLGHNKQSEQKTTQSAKFVSDDYENFLCSLSDPLSPYQQLLAYINNQKDLKQESAKESFVHFQLSRLVGMTWMTENLLLWCILEP